MLDIVSFVNDILVNIGIASIILLVVIIMAFILTAINSG